MRGANSYNYLIVEGYSDRIYFNKYLEPYITSNNLRILPVGGRDLVISLMEYLYLSMNSIQDDITTKIIGIIDNDSKQPSPIDITPSINWKPLTISELYFLTST